MILIKGLQFLETPIDGVVVTGRLIETSYRDVLVMPSL